MSGVLLLEGLLKTSTAAYCPGVPVPLAANDEQDNVAAETFMGDCGVQDATVVSTYDPPS